MDWESGVTGLAGAGTLPGPFTLFVGKVEEELEGTAVEEGGAGDGEAAGERSGGSDLGSLTRGKAGETLGLGVGLFGSSGFTAGNGLFALPAGERSPGEAFDPPTGLIELVAALGPFPPPTGDAGPELGPDKEGEGEALFLAGSRDGQFDKLEEGVFFTVVGLLCPAELLPFALVLPFRDAA
jgi:hypothetical protein